MSNIIGLAGKKGAGKTTLRNFIYSQVMNKIGYDTWLNEDGKIVASMGQDSDTVGIIDFDDAFCLSECAIKEVYPIFISYALADSLKASCNLFFGLSSDKLYGTNDDKNLLTEYQVGDLYGKAPHGRALKEFVSYREFMEQWAKKIRKIKDDVFRDVVKSKIENSESMVVMVSDLRDEGDVNFIKSLGGKVVKLTYDPHSSNSDGDIGFDAIPNQLFDLILDGNREENSNRLWDALNEWKYFN